MQSSDFSFEGDKGFKLSYQAAGFPLDKEVYPDGLRSDKKRSILRSIISRERKKSDLRVVWKNKGWPRFVREIKKAIANIIFFGHLSYNRDLQRHHYLVCGKFGMCEQDKEVNKRLLVYHCNQMKRCPVCSNRYHIGRSYEKGKIASAVMQANKIEHLRKFELTFPDFLWGQIKDADDMSIFKPLANKMFQGFFGCKMKGINGYISGSVGVYIQVHWYSSKECWKKKPHLHCYVIPLKLENDQVKNVDRYISKADLKDLRVSWSDCVKRAAAKLEYKGIAEIPDELVIHHGFINLPKNLKEKGRPGFNFRYDQRSPVEDLEKSVVAMDFNQDIVIMTFNQANHDYYAIWSFDDYVSEMLTRLNLKGTNSTYGWLRRFKYYASALGVEVKREEDSFIPVPDLEVKTEYRREYNSRYSKDTGKIEQIKIVYVRLLKAPNNPGPWNEVDPWKVHGEEIWTGSKQRYLYSVAKGRSPPG